MIDFYTWTTPNGYKVSILLEELGLEYKTTAVNIGSNVQYEADFLAINPNSKIPAIIDSDGPGGKPITLFESGAILFYLAEKHGKFLPSSGTERQMVMQWLMFQMGGVGPMFGQNHHFRMIDNPPEYALNRYAKETERLYRVMDGHLGKQAYFAGENYSIADMSIWPWVFRHKRQKIDLNTLPHVKAWYDGIAKRPAVIKGIEVPPKP